MSMIQIGTASTERNSKEDESRPKLTTISPRQSKVKPNDEKHDSGSRKSTENAKAHEGDSPNILHVISKSRASLNSKDSQGKQSSSRSVYSVSNSRATLDSKGKRKSGSLKSERRTTSRNNSMLHEVPGQYFHDDIVLNKYIAPHIVVDVSKLNFSSKDILVVGYPQSGVDKVSEIAYILQSGCDTYITKHRNLDERVPFIDLKRKDLNSPCEVISQAPAPRIARSNLTYRYLENHVKNDVKIIYVVRNPQDVMVAYYHMYIKSPIYGCYSGGWDDFFKLIKQKSLVYGDWCAHVEPWLEHKSVENILIIKYDQIEDNLNESISQISEFLEQSFTPSQLTNAVKYIDSIQTEESLLSQNLDSSWWEDHMTQQQLEYFENSFRSIVDEVWNNDHEPTESVEDL